MCKEYKPLEQDASPFDQFMTDKVDPIVSKKEKKSKDSMSKNIKPYLDKFDHLKSQANAVIPSIKPETNKKVTFVNAKDIAKVNNFSIKATEFIQKKIEKATVDDS